MGLRLNCEMHFIEQKVTVKNKIQSYENQVRLTMDDRSSYHISFDINKGEKCQIDSSETNWFDRHSCILENSELGESILYQAEKASCKSDHKDSDLYDSDIPTNHVLIDKNHSQDGTNQDTSISDKKSILPIEIKEQDDWYYI